MAQALALIEVEEIETIVAKLVISENIPDVEDCMRPVLCSESIAKAEQLLLGARRLANRKPRDYTVTLTDDYVSLFLKVQAC